jgi:hypothetical protein
MQVILSGPESSNNPLEYMTAAAERILRQPGMPPGEDLKADEPIANLDAVRGGAR